MHAPWACQHLAVYQPEPWMQGPIRWSPSSPLATLTKLIGISFVVIARLWWLREERKAMKRVDEHVVVKRNSTECVPIVWVCMYPGNSRTNKCGPLIMLLNKGMNYRLFLTLTTTGQRALSGVCVCGCVCVIEPCVYLSQVISPSQYWTVLLHVADFPHIVQA